MAFAANNTLHEMFSPFASGTRLLVTLINSSLVQLYDSSNPGSLVLLQARAPLLLLSFLHRCPSCLHVLDACTGQRTHAVLCADSGASSRSS